MTKLPGFRLGAINGASITNRATVGARNSFSIILNILCNSLSDLKNRYKLINYNIEHYQSIYNNKSYGRVKENSAAAHEQEMCREKDLAFGYNF